MDPDAALAGFFTSSYLADVAARNGLDVDEADNLRDAVNFASDLFEWLRNGGFAPDWSKR